MWYGCRRVSGGSFFVGLRGTPLLAQSAQLIRRQVVHSNSPLLLLWRVCLIPLGPAQADQMGAKDPKETAGNIKSFSLEGSSGDTYFDKR